MGHPDQHTPTDHRSSTDQSAPKPNVSEDIADDLKDEELKHKADTGPDVRTPEPDTDRQGEAGNAYVGREMGDEMKVNPRIENADKVQKED